MIMIINELFLIKTDVGNIPVIIRQVKTINETNFIGETFNNNDNIRVLSKNKNKCLEILKITINNYFDLWLENELSDLNISYGKK